jgi:20S proteasome subunit beta 4
MSDSVFGLVGKDFVIVAADATVEFSIVKFKQDEDKITPIDSKMIAAAGSQAERTQLMEYLTKNINLYQLRHGIKLSTKATASFIRSEMANAIRKNPFQVNMLIGGVDKSEVESDDAMEEDLYLPSLYYCDYMGALQKVNKGAQGYGAYFVLSILDRYWNEGLTESEGVEIMKMCVAEIKRRLLLDKSTFIIKIVDKNGVRVVDI